MTHFKSELLQTLSSRGFIHQGTDFDGLDALAGRETVTGYIGFDATASSLHVGSLVQIMMLRWMQRTGHRAIVLMGGGTTMIGDPTGKDESRKLLTPAGIEENIAGIRRAFVPFLAFDADDNDDNGLIPALMLNNADWLGGLGYVDLLRQVGTHFTINRMLTFDSVRLRLDREQPMTFLEFNYMILQAYDFMHLNAVQGCRLQLGGSDQWGNIVNGIELTRRMRGIEVYGLTSPLITTASGAKMGKTAAGAVWLAPHMRSPYDYWQFWRNTEDADVGRFLRLFTELPLDEIARLEALGEAEINEAKKTLAREATTLCHGPAAAREAGETARRTFEEGGAGTDLPTIAVSATDLSAGIPAVDLLVRSGLALSKGEARRLIKGGGGRVNDTRIGDPQDRIGEDAVNRDGHIKLSAGKKRHAIVTIGNS